MEKTEKKQEFEFNLKNIQEGKFDGVKGGKSSIWTMFASKRLLLESGQELSEKASAFLENLKYKWYYYNRKTDTKQGNIIIGLHKKDVPSWLYVGLNSKTGATKEYKNLIDAKNDIENI